jgi:protein-S-isoprenylcysteine O-methyltransferase Ste14
MTVAVRLEEATLSAALGETYARYVAGTSPVVARRFSVRRVRENREHQSLLGLVVSVAVLCLLAS